MANKSRAIRRLYGTKTLQEAREEAEGIPWLAWSISAFMFVAVFGGMSGIFYAAMTDPTPKDSTYCAFMTHGDSDCELKCDWYKFWWESRIYQCHWSYHGTDPSKQ